MNKTDLVLMTSAVDYLRRRICSNFNVVYGEKGHFVPKSNRGDNQGNIVLALET